MTENAPAAGWEDHDHEGLVHTHRHFHVTHNHNEMTGGFEHLSAAHEHEHDHAPLHHAHVPHQDLTASTPARRTSTTTTSRPRRDSGPEHLPDRQDAAATYGRDVTVNPDRQREERSGAVA